MKVREARLGDEGSIAEVHVRTWQAAYRGQVPDEFLASLSVERRTDAWQTIIAHSEAPARTVFVLEDIGRVVGFAGVAPSRDDEAGEEIGELTAIYVLPELWGAGGGQLLMEHALGSLRQAGFSQVTLWVLDTNLRARRFYEQLGWTADGATKVDQREDFALSEVRYRRAISSSPPR